MKKIIITISVFFLGFFFTNLSHASAATLYFNAGTNNNWNTLTNWWTDAGFSIQAGSLPTTNDDVIISGNVLSNTGSAASVNTLTANGTAQIHIIVTVANGATFNDSSKLFTDFAGLSQATRSWSGVATAPNGNVYAAEFGGDIYMQTAGIGNFVALNQIHRGWQAMAVAHNGNVYAAVQGGDIYMQTAGTGNFIALSQTTRNWQAMSAAPNGNVYAIVWGVDVYMQTNGTGNFVALGQTGGGYMQWSTITAAPNGNVYAAVWGKGIYIQTNGTGNFVSIPGTSNIYSYSMAAAPNGNIYVAKYNGDIYMQTNGTGEFVALN